MILPMIFTLRDVQISMSGGYIYVPIYDMVPQHPDLWFHPGYLWVIVFQERNFENIELYKSIYINIYQYI